MPKKSGRITESDLYEPTLILAASRPGGWIATSDLIAELTEIFQPEGEDAEILEGRQDTRFSQIVRNMISHKASPANIIGMGYAEHVDDGVRITEEGRNSLRKG
jgi:hypothetical protein